jgi:hypothetical protein
METILQANHTVCIDVDDTFELFARGYQVKQPTEPGETLPFVYSIA